ncbi:hypothetical protein JTB14_021769 [Gonioctena quinquepunctata]|nr:hypothetical protein JTB14_021769 [Gonioctena quinquepunctata]
MTRQIFLKKSFTKTTNVLDIIHTDLCGPMRTITPGGKKYILTFIDDFSRYSTIYLLSRRSEVFDKLREYVRLVQNKFNKKPKLSRSDRGGEYINSEVTNFLESEGIELQLTAPYSSQQNGVAERKNRYLTEMVICMLIGASLSNTYWGEAVMTANYLENLVPTNNIPFEIWNGMKGTKKNDKLCEKAKKYRIVGYENCSKAYRLLDESTGRISISRDVKMLEDYHSGYHQSKIIGNIKNDHEPQKIDDEVEIFVKNKKEDVTSDEIFGEQEIFDEGETEDIISGEMHTNNEGEKKDENSNSKKNKKMKNYKGDTIKLRRSERNNKDTGYYKNRNSNDDRFRNKDIYRSAIGALLYLSVNTRPDICVATSILGRNASDPYEYDWSEVKRIMKYLNGTIDMEIELGKKSSEIDEDIVYGYADADWAGDRSDRKSNSGYLFKFM